MSEKTLEQSWKEWHSKNPEFYEMFKGFAFNAINRGYETFSAWLIVNRIRWETMLSTTGDDYKISNDYIALYSRLFMAEYPEYQGFFKTKKTKRFGNLEAA
jgi:hypothetical protein